MTSSEIEVTDSDTDNLRLFSKEYLYFHVHMLNSLIDWPPQLHCTLF